MSAFALTVLSYVGIVSTVVRIPSVDGSSQKQRQADLCELEVSLVYKENGASVILCDITRVRENIQKSLAGSSGPGSSSRPAGDHSNLIVQIASLEVENKNL
ncbi:hypothetical protein U0070_000228 [Myodes glareolus]|uniref:Uncharacterized protein n=1 Tax=Myodes glareolus TaxID=447135 RepID=A0AAW0HB72_MYOGA